MITRRDFLKNSIGAAALLPIALAADATPSKSASTPGRISFDLGSSPWTFNKGDFYPDGFQAGFNDSAWEKVGVPHCYNDLDTYQNGSSDTYKGIAWYRKTFTLSNGFRSKSILLEFQGVSLAAAVYVNGKFQAGNTTVPQPGDVTHVGAFIPFALDITNDINFGQTNTIAVRVSNGGDSFFKAPGFGDNLAFCMGLGGIVCPVTLHVVHPVHIPLNIYSPLEQWGVYAGTVSASSATAKVRVDSNVLNGAAGSRPITLVTEIFDDRNRTVGRTEQSQIIEAGAAGSFTIDHDIERPRLWFPNNSDYGTPYLYPIRSTVLVDNIPVDSVFTPLGIRTVVWDSSFAYFNGIKHLLIGFGNRNSYPALGAAVPKELLWQDIAHIAACGGNTLRLGHVPATRETVQACNYYGVCVIQNSGDNEWSLQGEPAISYKREFDRDMMIAYRNDPSIVVWESNNGLAHSDPHYSPKDTQSAVDQWDSIQPRIVESRDSTDYNPPDRKVMIGYTNHFSKVAGSPCMNMESFGGYWNGDKSWAAARYDWDDEKALADHYITDRQSDIDNSACGWLHWMLAETQGESVLIYLNGLRNQKSLGSSAMDGNRIPKLIYKIYREALWVSFTRKPGVVLQSHWNLSGIQNVDAWSNCPGVELFLNETSLGVKSPDPVTRQVTWAGLEWQAGILRAVGRSLAGSEVASDQRVTAGDPAAIQLAVVPRLATPGRPNRPVAADGSDCAIIEATVVDKDGLWVPNASNNIVFSVSGPGNYRGSYNFYVTPDKPLGYHSPGDTELAAEGGQMRVAVRSTFTPGTVHVTASSDGLTSGRTQFSTAPPVNVL